MRADESLLELRNQVMVEVAKLAFEGTLEEKAEFLPEKIIPGTIPHYRCCVYKEREIVRQRVRLAMGKAPGENDNGNIIQVIEPACADCPISSYVVTDNCQNCVGKTCIKSCRFGAIHPGKWRSEIDSSKCRECGMCAKACPYNAIVHTTRPCKASCPVDALTYDENGLSVIDEEKCIRCGQCIIHCPFAAISNKDSTVQVIEALKSDRKVYAMAAPATEGQFGKGITMESWKNAMLEVGFDDFIEVGLGGDLTTASEAEEWYEAYEKGEMRTTSCCPGFVNMVNRHYPKLSPYVSTAVSPMCQVSRLIKKKEPDAVCVFIGPCIAKKSEILDQKIPGNADYALVYSEILAIMKAKGVELKPVETPTYQDASVFGKRYATAGGVANSCIEFLKEDGKDVSGMKVARISGGADLKKTLMLAERGRLEEQFIEGMCCEGGCFHGPYSEDDSPKAMRERNMILGSYDSRNIKENLANFDLSGLNQYRDPYPEQTEEE
ncbi:MAG: 4Fe-4S dicluster domain-containing protein [Eubacteriales bacterium]|nr:4Fe-4S dicluster domain-containing protein [Eubacteriales bacterium]